MKAVIISRYKSLDDIHIVEAGKPSAKKGEVLVRVKAASVSSGDERIRALNFAGLPMPTWLITPIMKLAVGFRAPRKIPGSTLSGVVEEVGEGVESFQAGDEIYAMTGFRFGALAEFAVLKADHCLALKPKKASFEAAAAIPFGATTAMHFLRQANIDDAKKVLIYGSTGAVGVAAVQIAAHKGAEVTAISGPDGQELSKKLGATHVYDYKKTSVGEIEETFDIIFDAVGHTSKKECASILAKGGAYVSVIGFDSASELSSDLEYIAGQYDNDEFVEIIDSTFELDDTSKAYERVGSGRKKGAVVVSTEKS